MLALQDRAALRGEVILSAGDTKAGLWDWPLQKGHSQGCSPHIPHIPSRINFSRLISQLVRYNSLGRLIKMLPDEKKKNNPIVRHYSSEILSNVKTSPLCPRLTDCSFPPSTLQTHSSNHFVGTSASYQLNWDSAACLTLCRSCSVALGEGWLSASGAVWG